MSAGDTPSGRRPRIAFAIPTVELGAYWKPVLDEIAPAAEELRVFTALPWRGADEEDFWPRGHLVRVGQKRRATTGDATTDYGGGVMVLSPAIVPAVAAMRPDVVIASGFSAWTILLLALRPLWRTRVLLLWEGSSPQVDHRDSERRTRLRRRLALMADAVMTNSPGGRDYLLDHLGLPAERVWQTPYMVPDPSTLDVAPVPRDDDRVRVLSVGRLEARKGNASLLAAVAALPDDLRRHVEVRLVGDGVEADALRAQAGGLGIAEQVTFAGWVPYEQLGGELAAADLLAFLTHEDTWGMVALEAMAAGTAVLCSRWAGVHPLVGDGLVVDPHEVGSVTEALAELVGDPEGLAALGREAAEQMAGHRPGHAAARLMAGARWAATGVRPFADAPPRA